MDVSDESTSLLGRDEPEGAARPPPVCVVAYGPLQAVSWAVVYVVQGLIWSRAL